MGLEYAHLAVVTLQAWSARSRVLSKVDECVKAATGVKLVLCIGGAGEVQNHL